MATESVLTLDLAAQPAALKVIQFDESGTAVLEERTVSLNLTAPKTPVDNAEPGTEDTPLTQDNPNPLGSALKEAVGSLSQPWSAAVLITPPDQYFSMNLELPFKDDKNIARVLDLEVQDRVPFPTDEFFLRHQVVGTAGGKDFDIHVSGMQRSALKGILQSCQSAGIDPLVVAPFSSLIAPFLAQSPERYADTCAFLIEHGGYWYLVARVSGSICYDRAIPPIPVHTGEDPSLPLRSELRRSLLSCEKRYNLKFSQIWVSSEQYSPEQISSFLSRPVERLSLGASQLEIIEQSPRMVADGQAQAALCNFRFGPFAYTLKWGELLNGLKSCLSYLLLLVLGLAVVLILTYVTRERHIQRMNQVLHERVASALAPVSVPHGKEIETISAVNNKIDDQLKDIGSPAKLTALAALAEISRDMPSLPNSSIKGLLIRGSEVTLEGSAQSYSQVEEMENALKTKKSVYCKVSRDVTGGNTGSRGSSGLGFKFELRLCD